MNVSLNIGDDFAGVVDGLEAVALTSRTGEVTTVSHALRRARHVGEAVASDGHVSRSDITWHLPLSELPTQPELGAIITDQSGASWTILEVRQETQCQRWRIEARDLAIALGLDTLITIQQVTLTKDVHGGSLETWSDWKPHVRAKFQPITSRPAVSQATLAQSATHVVLLLEDLALRADQRIVDGDQRVYRIERIQKAERLGQPTEIYVRQETWP